MQKYQMMIMMKKKKRMNCTFSNNHTILLYDSCISTGNIFFKAAKHISINIVGRHFNIASSNEHLSILHYLKRMTTTMHQMLTFLEAIEGLQVQVVSVMEAEKYNFS